MDKTAIRQLIRDQRSYFSTGITKDIAFRREQLVVLKKAVKAREHELFRTLRENLRKPAFESYGGDSAIVINEIDHAVRQVDKKAVLVRSSRPKNAMICYTLRSASKGTELIRP